MARTKIRTVAVDEIIATFYVRKELNEGRVSQLIKLAQAGTVLPPILVWWDDSKEKYEMIDGRHRLEMARRLEWPNIQCECVDEPDIASRIALAVSANTEGPLSPSDEDYMGAIGAMIDRGASRQRILALFPLPKSYTMKLYHDHVNLRKRHNVNKARADMVNANLTLIEAAAKYKVDLDDLKAAIGPKKKRSKVETTDFIGAFSGRFKAFSSSNAQDYRKIFDAYDAGHLSADECRKLWKNVAHRFKVAASGLEDWRGRFEVKVHEAESGVSTDANEATAVSASAAL